MNLWCPPLLAPHCGATALSTSIKKVETWTTICRIKQHPQQLRDPHWAQDNLPLPIHSSLRSAVQVHLQEVVCQLVNSATLLWHSSRSGISRSDI